MARLFNGSSDYITAAPITAGLASNSTARTWTGWVKPIALPSAGNYVGLFGIFGDTHYQRAYLKDTGTLAYYCNNNGGILDGAGVRVIAAGTWHHVAWSFDGSLLRQYVDGVFDASTTASGSVGSTSTNADIGQDVSTPGRFFNGSIADVAAYDATLSVNEIAALAHGARPPSIRPAMLVAYWPLTGKNIEPDSSGYRQNGTLIGTKPANGPFSSWDVPSFRPWLLGGQVASGGGGFLAAWARNRNLGVIGTGTY